MVAFNYCCADSVPKTPYATTLDAFINANFIIIMVVGMVIFLFSYFAYIDVRNGHVHWVNNDDDTDENAVGYPRYTAGQPLLARRGDGGGHLPHGALDRGYAPLVQGRRARDAYHRRVSTTSSSAGSPRKRAIPVCERQLRNKGTAS